MLAGLPVVATAVGEVPTVLAGGRAGVLVPPGNAITLADGLGGLLADPARLRRLGVAAEARATEAYTFSRMMDSYVSILAKLLGNLSHDGRAEGVRHGQRQALPEERSPRKRALVG